MWDWEVIDDWKYRISKYTDEQKEFYTNMVPKLLELKNVLNSASDSSWTLLADDPTDGVKVEFKKSVRGLLLMRAKGKIEGFTAKEVYRCSMCFAYRSQWDVNNEFFVFKKKIGVNAFILHSKTKKKLVVASRDFVVNYLIQEEADGTVMFSSTSENCD